MKTKHLFTLAATLLAIFLSSYEILSQHMSLDIQPNPQGFFAVAETKSTAKSESYSVYILRMNNKPRHSIATKRILDSIVGPKSTRAEEIKLPVKLGWQCYFIRIKKDDGRIIFFVLAGNKTGAIYGGLDLVKTIKLESIISNVICWEQNYICSKYNSVLSPHDEAYTICKYSKLAQMSLQSLPLRKSGSSYKPDQTLGGIAAFVAICKNYAEKIRSACNLAPYNYCGLEQDRKEEVQHSQYAREWWAKYATIYNSQYRPVFSNRISFIIIHEQVQKTKQDIDIAKAIGSLAQSTNMKKTKSSFPNPKHYENQT